MFAPSLHTLCLAIYPQNSHCILTADYDGIIYVHDTTAILCV